MSEDGQELVLRKTLSELVDLARPRGGMAIIDAILEHPAAAELIPALDVEELYALMVEIGKSDCVDLVRMASHEQLEGLVDLDSWIGNTFVPERLDGLMGLFGSAGQEATEAFFESMSDETIVLYIKKRARIEARTFEPEQEDTFTDEMDVIITPDTLYFVIMPKEHPSFHAVNHFIDFLYSRAPLDAAALLKHAIYEDLKVLEDDAAHFREARVRTMGFMAANEVEELFSYVNPFEFKDGLKDWVPVDPAELPDTGTLIPALLGYQDNLPPFLKTVMDELEDIEVRNRMVEGLAYLANSMMVWETRGDLADRSRRRGGILRGFSLVNLGLEFLADEDPKEAAHLILRVWPKDLFRIGYSLTMLLHQQAERLLPLAGREAGFFLFDPPLSQAIQGAFLPIPQYYEGLLGEGEEGYRDFYRAVEVRNTRAALRQARGVAEFVVRSLQLDLEKLAAAVPDEFNLQVTHTTLMATALVNALLGNEELLRPVSPAEVPAVLDLVLVANAKGERTLNPRLAEAVKKFPADQENRFAAVMFDLSLKKLEALFRRVPAGAAPDRKLMAPVLLVG